MLFRPGQLSATFPHRTFLHVVGAVLALVASAHVAAEPSYDPRELRLIPAYCKYTQYFRARLPGGNNPDEIARWTQEMGGTFNHMHHYCWGLMYTNRALFLARTERLRTEYLGHSIEEFNYVIDRASLDFKLLPEILTKKCENLLWLDRDRQGMQECERAISLKPNYWPAYAAMSDYYTRTGDPAKARERLEAGLSAAPGTNALTRRLTELNSTKSKRSTELPAER